MKLKWWILGMAAITASSVFLMKHFCENKMDLAEFAEKKSENNCNTNKTNNAEAEFEASDFLM